MHFRTVLLSFLALLPSSALAADVLHVDFSKGLQGFEIQGWNGVTPTDKGLDIRTTSDGGMFVAVDPSVPREIMKLTTMSQKVTSALALWERNGEVVQYQFSLPGGGSPKETVVYLNQSPDWNSKSTRFGVALPGGSNILVQDVTLLHYGMMEKFGYAVKSLFKTDTFQTFSINFLWGPLLGFSPEEIATLYDGQPPRAWSAMRAVYLILLIAIVVSIVIGLRSGKYRAWKIVGGAIVVLWLLLDIRMSGELLSYAANDWKTYLLAPPEERVLRDRENYYRTVELSLPYLTQDPTYAFISQWPVKGSLRYFTYPSLPVTPTTESEGKNLRYWLVFSAPNASFENNRLMVDRKPISPAGHIVRTFGDGSFLFQVP